MDLLRGHLPPAVVTEVVDRREELPHQDHPGITAPLRQDDVGRPPGKRSNQGKGEDILPEETQELPLVLLAKRRCIQTGPKEFHEKIITDLIPVGKDAGGRKRQFATVELGDVASDIEGVGIAGPVQVADGTAAETRILVVIDDVLVDHRPLPREAPGR